MRTFALAASVVAGLAASATALGADRPSGTYKTRVQTTALQGRLNGLWTITFKHGRYTVTDNGRAVVHGKYVIKSGKITFHDTSGPAACPGRASYRYRLQGASLKFTNVDDKSASCIGRRLVLKRKFVRLH
jgi:hypothetical protein